MHRVWLFENNVHSNTNINGRRWACCLKKQSNGHAKGRPIEFLVPSFFSNLWPGCKTRTMKRAREVVPLIKLAQNKYWGNWSRLLRCTKQRGSYFLIVFCTHDPRIPNHDKRVATSEHLRKNIMLQVTMNTLLNVSSQTTKTSFSYQGEPRWTTSGCPASKFQLTCWTYL